MRRSCLCSVLVLVLLFASACRQPSSTSTPELQSVLTAEAPGGVSPDVWRDVQAYYAGRGQSLAWLRQDGPSALTFETLDTLRAAQAHGLDPAAYGEPDLRQRVESLQASREDETAARARLLADLDVRLTSALLALARHVATGRLSPEIIDRRWNSKREPPDYVAALQAVSEGGVAALLDAVAPRHPEYRGLTRALASLRGEQATGWVQVPRIPLKMGQQHAAVPALRQRLAASGYLPAGASLESTQFDADVDTGVKAFKEHHGLPATGVLDRATIDEMNVPIDARIRQVAMNMERWRWMPDDLGARHLLVNLPDYHLFAREGGRVTLDIRVVIGKRGNETPLFSDQMETVVFSPYWNIPETIALEETAPAVRNDPDFLARNNIEVVNASGEVVPIDAIPWDDEGALEDYRFRQRPGANNALGHVKFLFPNKHAVYLHDTPAEALFARVGRAFSHGCVRVEEPHVLAQYLLRDQPQWTADAISTAMHAGDERHVALAEKIPVHIVYFTAWVDERGGLHFAEDVYGYDDRQAGR